MKSILLSDIAYIKVDVMRKGNGHYSQVKDNLCKSFETVAQLLQIGREEETVNEFADGLLRVFETLADYNALVDALCARADDQDGRYQYKVTEDN